MTVPVGDRSESKMEFIATADKIEKRAMEVCKNWPKRYMFIITQRTIQLASEVYEYAQKANAIIPQTEEERTQRIIYLQKALGSNFAFAQKIERAFSMFPLCTPKQDKSEEERKSWNIFEEFMGYCDIEEKSLTGNITYTRSMELDKPPPKEN